MGARKKLKGVGGIKETSDVEEEEDEELPHKSKAQEGEDEDDSDATSDSDSDMETNENQVYTRCGLIKSLQLFNFMCHHKLQVDFGTNVNFIVGENGSGKSAVLTGIVLGLGGKIGSTGRGTKQNKVIKFGQDQALIRIDLYNEGDDAYKPELYGNVIRVEKSLKKTGSQSIKLINAQTGKTIDTTSSELHSITDQFNIQVDNPVAVLNQEMSKRFFQATKSNKKYELFLEGMQLDVLETLHSQIIEHVGIQQAALGNVDHQLEIAQRESIQAENEYKDLVKLQGLAQKKTMYQQQMVWAGIAERESIEEQHKDELVRTKQELQERIAKIAEYEERIRNQQVKEQECTTRMNEISQRVQEHLSNTNEVTALVKERKRKEKQRKDCEAKLRKSKKDKENLLKHIEREKEQAYAEHASQSANQGSRLRELEDHLEQAQQKYDANTAQIDKTSDDLSAFAGSLKNADYEINKASSDASQCKDELRRLSNSNNDRFSVFGREMKQVKERIDSERWNIKPLGPLAFEVQMLEDKWARVVNLALGNQLKSFLVHDPQDQKKLIALLKQGYKGSNQRPPVVYYAKKEPRFTDVQFLGTDQDGRSLKTINDVIRVENDQVWNLFVTYGKIHQTMIIEDQEHAADLVFGRGKQGCRCPPSFQGTIWEGLEGDSIVVQGQGANKMPKSVPKQFKGRPVPYISHDVASDVARLKHESANADERLKFLKAQCATETRQKKALETQHRRMVSDQQKLEDRIVKLEGELQALRNVEVVEEVDESQFDQFEDEATQLEQHVEQYTQEVANAEAEELQARKLEKPMQEKRQEAEREKAKLEKEQAEFFDALNLILKFMEKEEAKKKKVEKIVSELEQAIKVLDEDLRLDAVDIENEKAAAANLKMDKVDVKHTSAQLATKLKGLEKAIEREERNRGKSAEEITENYKLARERFEAANDAKVNAAYFTEKLKKSKDDRTKLSAEMKHAIGRRCNRFFKDCLEQKKFAGRMKFDHGKKDLNINVDVTGSDAKKVNSKGLSGGEKSFTTACFIVSLWDAMETPFRCLDEFDVFMDDVNRKLSIQMMIDVAKGQGHRQFVYLSPLGMKVLEKYKADPTIKVIRMKKQVSGQTSLDDHIAPT
eukprot:m.212603 g.212603  ORF g.212603 m.212603 type:complete len:1121 (-) comp33128_c0_seq1:378-3740(-)